MGTINCAHTLPRAPAFRIFVAYEYTAKEMKNSNERSEPRNIRIYRVIRG